jgi:hypothetical protein
MTGTIEKVIFLGYKLRFIHHGRAVLFIYSVVGT